MGRRGQQTLSQFAWRHFWMTPYCCFIDGDDEDEGDENDRSGRRHRETLISVTEDATIKVAERKGYRRRHRPSIRSQPSFKTTKNKKVWPFCRHRSKFSHFEKWSSFFGRVVLKCGIRPQFRGQRPDSSTAEVETVAIFEDSSFGTSKVKTHFSCTDCHMSTLVWDWRPLTQWFLTFFAPRTPKSQKENSADPLIFKVYFWRTLEYL